MLCLVKNSICARRIVVADEPLQVFAGFQTQRGGLVNGTVMKRFYNDLARPMSIAVGAPLQVRVSDEPLVAHNWCWMCAEMQRSAICLFEISDGNPNIALLIGTAMALSKRCVFLKKRNAKDQLMLSANEARVFTYDYLEKPAFKQALIDFSVQVITSNYWKPRQPPLMSRARFVRYLREKQNLITERELSSDKILSAHEHQSNLIDEDFRRYGEIESQARVKAQIQLEKETKLCLEKNDHFFSGVVADIDLKISDGTTLGLPVSDGIYNYLVVKGVKLRVPDDQSYKYPALARNLPIPNDLLDLLETDEPQLFRQIAHELALI